jgi:glycosyl hydrolase family 57
MTQTSFEIPASTPGLPSISGAEAAVIGARASAPGQALLAESGIDFSRVRSASAVALHMHQPLIPAGPGPLTSAALISNLEHMLNHEQSGDNHNARVFHECYKRMGPYIRQLVDAGKQPRIMLEYSGTLLYGLERMGFSDVEEQLRIVTTDPRYRPAVEWLGAAWGHAVAPSTPAQDYRKHVLAWQQHFARTFGGEALARVRGFSPAEMALPNHPDTAYEFVRTLRDAGYTWVLVQEHSVELRENGAPPRQKHLPHRLVCKNSRGESASIIAIIKTQGSDTKLVGQMQPYYEAKGLTRLELAGQLVPPLVTQIADGENGGVMMNEFPPKYLQVVEEASGSDTPLLNVSEYLEYLWSLGVQPSLLPELQPILQKRIWDRLPEAAGPERLATLLDELKAEDGRFHVEGGSWTNDISWVRGYGKLLNDMEQVSALFDEKVTRQNIATSEPRYQNALFHLMCSQTSCFRYWGEGAWTDFGREICRRTREILTRDF